MISEWLQNGEERKPKKKRIQQLESRGTRGYVIGSLSSDVSFYS